jgi:hypothetical protein
MVIDENGVPVSGAEVTLSEPSLSPILCRTDFAGLRLRTAKRLTVPASRGEAGLL